MYSKILPIQLKEMRQSHNFTQKEVAEELNISQVTLSHYETGKRQPDIETLAQLADFYGVSTDFLIGNGLHGFHGFEPVSNWDGMKVRTAGFPQRLKYARQIKGQSQQAVAKSLKIHQSALAMYELGQLQPNIDTLAKLTIYYRVQADWLLGLKENDHAV